MTPIAVTLTWPEVLSIGQIGCMQHVQNLKEERSHRYGCNPAHAFSVHIESAGAELAVAKHFNVYWMGHVGDRAADDVYCWQVRQASFEHYRLILHDDDIDDKPYIHVTGLAPRYLIWGWIYARDGKQPQFWQDPVGGRPAYFVPRECLLHMDNLPK